MGVAVTFIAILELKREGLIEIVQNEAYAPIHISGVAQGGQPGVIEGSAVEVVEDDARLLAESIAAHGADDADDGSHEDEDPEDGGGGEGAGAPGGETPA
jgi:segregation and condensation protein A